MVAVISAPHIKTELKEIVRREVDLYAANSLQGYTYPVLDDDNQHYTALHISHYPPEFPPSIIVMARVVNDKIIIEVDNTDKPLVNALMQNAGIAREDIILAYAGEML
jgi:hypothetical protein